MLWFTLLCVPEVMIFIVLNLLFLGCHGFVLPQDNAEIVNSTKVTYQVLISYGDVEPLCGGALVTDSVILTTASCIYTSFGSKEAFVKNAELFGGGKVLVYMLGNITNVIIHPAFKQNESANDIALVKVWQPLPKKRISPVPLASSWDSDKVTCTLSTWWDIKTSHFGNLSPRDVRLEKCFDHNVDDYICAATNNPNITAINKNDIGSPIVCDGKLTAMATVSDKAINLTFYYSWIKEAIRELGPLNDTSEILEPSTVNVLDRLQSQKIISLLNELKSLAESKNESSNNELQNYWNPRVVVPLNYVIFATVIFLFSIMLYHTLVNIALVYFSRRK